jgi:hypothetical protein
LAKTILVVDDSPSLPYVLKTRVNGIYVISGRTAAKLLALDAITRKWEVPAHLTCVDSGTGNAEI